jgi:hypothetical protein
MRLGLPVALVLALASLTVSNALLAAEPVRTLLVLPQKIELSTTAARQRLLAQFQAEDKFFSQATAATFRSSDEKIVRVENGYAVPVANGEAEIIAQVGEQTARAKVVVSRQDQPFQWSFRNHVESVLSKQGCNGGACHGARAGQKGFRLALFGFDVEADYNYLTRQAGGRRILPSDPGRSLLLTKPTGLLPHKGGVRLDAASPEYRVLAEWIAAGTPGPQHDDPQITCLEVLPPHSIQQRGAEQQLVVLAHFSDGHTEDATRWAKYTVTNSAVASVDGEGRVKINGSGESAVNVWYLNLTTNAFVSAPYEFNLPAETFAKLERHNFIDDLVNAKLTALRLPASPPCDDATFIRRVFLDTTGTLPKVEEVTAFLANSAPDKRNQLIESLLARPEFVDYWTYKWADLLLINGARLRPAAVKAFHGWLRASVAENKPWDRLVTEIVTASGNTLEQGAANFYSLHKEPEEISETIAQAFLGLSINCAKCHNHPLEKWTNDQYYGMANMFSRVRAKGWGGDVRNGDGQRSIFSETSGELLQPSRGLPQPPRPLDGEPLAFEDPQDRRIPLAAWLTSPKNPYFARAITNRVWANYFGVGLVEKVDDLRSSNPASNEALLAACSQYLIEHKFDLKSLMRVMLQSAAYQRSSETTPENKIDTLHYSHYFPRRLKAEVLLDAFSQVTEVPTPFKDQPTGTRALQLSDVSIASYFLDTFGRPEREITCDCERTDEPNIPQVLHLYNGNTMSDKLQAKAGRIARTSKPEVPVAQVIDELFLAALARYPTEKERQSLHEILNATTEQDRRVTIEDFYWSLLTSREFMFQH